MRATAAGPWGVICAGKEGEVPEAIGRAMIKARAAVEVTAIKQPALEIVRAIETATIEPDQHGVTIDPPRRRRKHAEVQESPMPA